MHVEPPVMGQSRCWLSQNSWWISGYQAAALGGLATYRQLVRAVAPQRTKPQAQTLQVGSDHQL